MPEPPGWMAERIADHVLAKPEPLVEQTLDHERRTAVVVESNCEQGGRCERDGEPSPRGTPPTFEWLQGSRARCWDTTVVPAEVSQGHATAVVVEYMPPLAVMKPEVTSVTP